MNWIALIAQLKKFGIPGCLILTVVALMGAGTFAESRYAKSTEFNTFAERQLAQSIREVHQLYCQALRDKEKVNQGIWWRDLQDYQREFKKITGNGEYKLPICSKV